MDDHERNAVIHRYFDGLDNGDFTAVGSLFADDGIRAAPGQDSIEGRTSITEFLEAQGPPSVTHEVLHSLHGPRVSYCKVRVSNDQFEGENISEFQFDTDGRISLYRYYMGYVR